MSGALRICSFAVAAALLAPGVAGCGGPSLYDVSGVVTSRGKPVSQAKVAFYDGSGAIAGMGDIEAAGEFVVPDGLPAGSYDVAVFPFVSGSGAPPPSGAGPDSVEPTAPPPPPFPEKYLAPGTSGLRRDVVADGENRFELRLD